MSGASSYERLGTDRVGKLLWELGSQTTFSLLVYAIYSITDVYFLSVGIGPLAAAGASIISPVLIALGGVATTVGADVSLVMLKRFFAQPEESEARLGALAEPEPAVRPTGLVIGSGPSPSPGASASSSSRTSSR